MIFHHSFNRLIIGEFDANESLDSVSRLRYLISSSVCSLGRALLDLVSATFQFCGLLRPSGCAAGFFGARIVSPSELSCDLKPAI